MPYQTDPLAQKLHQARLHKGWTQRDLSQRAGLPQAHISKIENGAVDPKLSTVVELARFLDLELILAPRGVVPAIRALVREAETNRDLRSVRGVANSLTGIVSRLRQATSESPLIERLATLAAEIGAMAPAFQAPGALAELEDALRGIETAAEVSGGDSKNLARAVDQLAKFRNSMAHRALVPSERPGPAYNLDDED